MLFQHPKMKIKAVNQILPKCGSQSKGQGINAYHVNGLDRASKINLEQKFKNYKFKTKIYLVNQNKNYKLVRKIDLVRQNQLKTRKSGKHNIKSQK